MEQAQEHVLETTDLCKSFDLTTALDAVSLAVPAGALVGLVGRNGSGKTTLLRHAAGLLLPTRGTCVTLGKPAGELGHDELARIGVVPQENRFLEWMTVDQHLRYVASFYPRWDREREEKLRRDLELDTGARVGTLSAGNAQKLAIVLAMCHHPELLLLDEPMSDLDPIVRGRLLAFLVEVLGEDEATVVVSSHVLRDVEQIVDRVICLDRGRVATDAALDDLQELYAEWRVTAETPEAATGCRRQLPASFAEPFVLRQEVDGHQASLLVRQSAGDLESFRAAHRVEVASRPLNLERIFPLLVMEEAP